MPTRPTAAARPRRGRSATGMEYVTWGSGPRSLLFIPGGPPSRTPKGLFGWWAGRSFAPYVERGYTVWYVTRRRGMPRGHTLTDIAADHAGLIGEVLGGRVDVVVGESLGGLVAQHLAAQHPELLRRLVLVASGWEVTDWTKEVDARVVAAVARGDRRAAGAAFLEYVIPGPRRARLRRRLGGVAARWMLFGQGVPAQDVLVEADAERSCDTRPLLPRIEAPVLLIAGDRDRFFSEDIIKQTAGLIPKARITWYPGKDHFAVCSSSQVPKDVLAFADAN